MTCQHKALLEYFSQEAHSLDFDSCMEDQQSAVRIDAEERYLSYALLRQSRTQHIKLKANLQNNFITGNNLYPKSRPQTLHLLDKYSKIAVPKIPTSEILSFAQGDANRGNRIPLALVTSFRYIGRVLSEDKYNCPAVVRDLHNSWQK